MAMIALLSSRARRGICAALLCWSAPLLSTTAAAQPTSWTLDAVERVALERSPQIQNALAALRTAEAYREFGKMPRVLNPVVTLRAMVGKPDDPAATYSVNLGLPFEVAGQRRAWRKEAGFVVLQAEAELAALQNEVRASAREAYVLVATAEAAEKVARESAATAKELVDRVRARVEASASTILDLALAESQYSESEANVARAERTLVEAQGALRQVLDLPASEVLSVNALAIPEVPRGLTLEQAVTRALSERREATAFAHTRDRFRASDRRLRAEAVGPLTAGLEAERQGNQRSNSSVGATMSFELPFVRTNQGDRAVAKGQAANADVQRELAEHTVAREATTTYQRLEAALRELAELETRALPAAERTLTMVGTLLDAGAIDYFRLLTARSSAFALRSRRVETLREAWLSRIALERAIGGWKETP